MPTFRITHLGGDIQTVQASRVVTDGAVVCFETQVDGRWRSVHSIPAERVVHLQRRINESVGWRWIIARPMPTPGHVRH
ncbi:hypothetical protein ACIA59_23670 [Micromonospora haikouensis]|uniref:hypothetical protein n=1 Tax=Micromonospora haikouensis TaxID=686309 RepID=UPI0037AE46DD